MSRADLPIDRVLPDLLAALDAGPRALLSAPPGAGKTTRVAPALLDERWCTGQVLLLVPRRLAARAAAEHMAREAGEAPGQAIGYATRLDSKVGKATRLIVMTHGVFLAKIQDDPELGGVSAVLFDEVHERSLDGDLSLALALDAAAGLREDLRLIAMSATLDAEGFARLLDNPPHLVSEGRSHPLAIHYRGRDAAAKIEPQVARAIREAMAAHEGSALAFLPGVAEIERTADALGALAPDTILHRLHGQVDPAAQRAALAPPPPGKRKIVLASAIAETSVTVDDVAIVVDSGLSRRPRFDLGAGLTRLVTERASQAAVVQRAGRAARQRPGVAIRLWEEAATQALPRHDPPEILEADLSGLLLATLGWGAGIEDLAFIDPPPAPALAEARARLAALGAIDADGRLTEHGRRIARWPLEPRLAHMMIEAGARGFARAAADAATLLAERGIGGREADLDLRRRRWRAERGPRAEAARAMARRWAERAAHESGVAAEGDPDLGMGIALAFPDRLSRRRDPNGETWQSVGGRGFRLDPASPLASAEWLAVAEVAGAASGARILSAARIEEAEVRALFGSQVEEFAEVRYDPESRRIDARKGRRLGAIRLSSAPDPAPDDAALAAGLLDALRRHGLGLLPWSERSASLRRRAAFAARMGAEVPDLSDAALLERADEWLVPLLGGVRRLDRIDPGALGEMLTGLVGHAGVKAIDRLAPTHFATSAGSNHPIDYEAEGGPTVEIRVQALYGLSRHPSVAEGRVPLTLSLTSPAHRPIQTTRDLPAFWAGSWREVAKEMRGRYPKHPWPDDPASALPTLRTKRAGGGS